MLHTLRYLLKNAAYALYARAWIFISVVMAVLYLGGYLLMDLAGEQAIIENYAWWFIVTSTTVGYGDYAPVSFYGRLVAVPIMLLGIGVLAMIIAKLTESILKTIEKRDKGLVSMKESGHILIMGYRPGSTQKVIRELRADGHRQAIILCSSDQHSNPFKSDKIGFVQGELASREVMRRCSAASADKCIIHGIDDNQTFFTAYAFRGINTHAHMVCYLHNEEHADKIYNLPADRPPLNQVILPVYEYLMAQELQDPESSKVFQQLITNLDGATLHRITYRPESGAAIELEELFVKLKRDYQATIVAMKRDSLISNPPLSERIRPGDVIFYIAEKRISELSI